MTKTEENINFLKNFVKKRETYIRFSPFGTGIVGIMFILSYFFGEYYSSALGFNNPALYFVLGILSILTITILSLANSKNKKEELLPKSIRYIIINLILFGITYFIFLIFFISPFKPNEIVETSLIFYGLLIIVSRFCIPPYIKYFGLISFIGGILGLFYPNYINEITLIVLGIGHLVIAYLLKIDNDK